MRRMFAIGIVIASLTASAHATPIRVVNWDILSQDDEIFTKNGASGAGINTYGFVETTLSSGIYSLTFSNLTPLFNSHGYIQFTIDLLPPSIVFNTINILTGVVDGNTSATATAQVYSDTNFSNLLLSTTSPVAGGGAGAQVVPGNLSSIYVAISMQGISGSAPDQLSTITFQVTEASVPEPASLALLGLGLGALGVVRRRRG